MGSVGLLYVGAVLFVNAMMLLGRVDARAAAPINLFVGAMQVILPTLLLVAAGTDVKLISAAAGIYLFGFTYLYVGIGLLAGLDNTGVGWFSLFVSFSAIIFALINFFDVDDPPFGVIWLSWSYLWFLYFLLFGLGREELTSYTGWMTLVNALGTVTMPAFLLLTDNYTTDTWFAVTLAVCVVVLAVALWPLSRPGRGGTPAPGQPATGP
ncbi:AmiS/UreI family transporter [Actinomadura pelletieri DSM 43383]|uniref:AmiS/UreI family transporter n=1 Tax=Actinomadura pelletieri DSM 43383 TaxID=1120940 RepID=A0A495QU25_9ACTN|nr:AmiS/UreI family transporter [Actinomadura pelletieri]RKS76958.1 AmiS/UreI family transporter [Actinomadura pelletieri DSM 43383]